MARTNSVLSNRSKEEILANMIEVTFSPVNKTAIMYRAGLSYTQLRLYLRFLQDSRLIVTNDSGQWVATDRGRQFVQAYSTLKEILDR
jgi:predicted transcriptional regulator